MAEQLNVVGVSHNRGKVEWMTIAIVDRVADDDNSGIYGG